MTKSGFRRPQNDKKDTEFGQELLGALDEVRAHIKGKKELIPVEVALIDAEQVRDIRRSVSKSTREFGDRFGVPKRTIEGWEQGREMGIAGRILMHVIKHDPEAVTGALRTERAVKKSTLQKQAVKKASSETKKGHGKVTKPVRAKLKRSSDKRLHG